ncbi:putative Agglutinin domain-containing protein [Helianthus anomalus]
MAMASLPRFFAMRATSEGAYLCVQKNPPSSRPLRFNERQIFSPRVKFAVEDSTTGDYTVVHIRSCYNNKYWVVHNIQVRLWIGASVERPQEDPTNPACTLFRPSQSGTQG